MGSKDSSTTLKDDINQETYHLVYLMLLTETELRLKSDHRSLN